MRAAQYRQFEEVNKAWCKLMNEVFKNPLIKDKHNNPGNLKMMKSHNAKMDDIQAALDAYLDEKRVCFPRFYFISNDELLQILADTKDITKVERHLPKIFQAIY